MICNLKNLFYLYFILSIVGCSNSDQLYSVKGTIQDIKLDDREVIIAHDTIRDLMLPMIMPFPISKES